MNFDPDLVLKYANFMLTIAVGIYAFFVTRRKDVEKQFEAVEEQFKAGSKKFAAVELRVELLESAVQELPKKEDMHALAITLSEMGGDMKAMRASLRAMTDSLARTERIVSRHEDHLLNGGKS